MNRIKRPELKRSAPNRSLRGFFGPQPSAATNGTASNTDDPIAYGVDLGYRVIEDYLRQGQAFARGAASQPRSSRAASLPEPQRLVERMVQQASDLAALWLDYVQLTNGAGSPKDVKPTGHGGAFELDPKRTNGYSDSGANGTPRSAPDSAGAVPRSDSIADSRSTFASGSDSISASGSDAGSVSGSVSASGSDSVSASGSDLASALPRPARSVPLVAFAIASKRAVEVACDLKPGAAQAALLVHDLRAVDPELERIVGILAESQHEANRVLVRIRVPDQQAPATYSGLIVDELTNLPLGTLAVRVLD